MNNNTIQKNDEYYLRALQVFAHLLAKNADPHKLEETNIEYLISFINSVKTEYSEPQFYFLAGRASQQVLIEASVKGCNGPAECLPGLYLFDNLINLYF